MKNANQLVASITATAVILAEGKSEEELALLSSIFSQLGDILGAIGAVHALNGLECGGSTEPAVQVDPSGHAAPYAQRKP